MDVFLENSQTAFDPPLVFGNYIALFSEKIWQKYPVFKSNQSAMNFFLVHNKNLEEILVQSLEDVFKEARMFHDGSQLASCQKLFFFASCQKLFFCYSLDVVKYFLLSPVWLLVIWSIDLLKIFGLIQQIFREAHFNQIAYFPFHSSSYTKICNEFFWIGFAPPPPFWTSASIFPNIAWTKVIV